MADEFLSNLDVEKSFLTMMQNSDTIHKKTDESDYMKNISFMVKKNQHKQSKKANEKAGNININRITDKGLIP